MQSYHEILETIASKGYRKGDRTGTGTTSWFGQHKRFSLNFNFKPRLPVVTTKKIHLPSIEHELLWMLSGDTRLEYLIANGVRIWNEWVKPGTEVWKALTIDELKIAILKKYNANEEDFEVIPCIASSNEFEVNPNDDKDPYDDQEPVEPKLVDYRWNPYLGKDCLFIDVTVYGKTVVDVHALGEHVKEDYVKNWSHWATIYKIVFEKEPRKLIGGDLGPVYGKTWRDIEDTRIVPKLDWPDYEKRGFDFVIDVPGTDYTSDRAVVTRRVDQVKEVLHLLENDPDSRRIIICAWDPRLVEDQALPPCHAFIQFWTRELTLEERYKWDESRCQLIEQSTRELYEKTGEELLMMYPHVARALTPRGMSDEEQHLHLDKFKIPRRAISCQLYQRS